MFRFIFVLVLCAVILKENAASVPGEIWVTRARLVDAIGYFTKVMQEFVYELEKREWSSLKMVDVTQHIDTVIANWHVNGTVQYANGFVVSIQKIDITGITSLFGRVIQNNVTLIPTAIVRGTLNFRHMNIGYDVIPHLQGVDKRRYTGEILLTNAPWLFSVSKNLITREITQSASENVSGNNRMVYRPADHVTEVLSRFFAATNNGAGIKAWSEIFLPIFTDIVHNKIEFPDICFNNCT